ncbi:hypothetical protein Q7P37_002281 [Cladosporium fusiforme]
MSRMAPGLGDTDFGDGKWTSQLVRALDLAATPTKDQWDARTPQDASRAILQKDMRDAENDHRQDEDFKWTDYFAAHQTLFDPDDSGADFYRNRLRGGRKNARAWAMRSFCHGMLMEDRVSAVEKIMQSKGFLALEDESPQKSPETVDSLLESGTLFAVKQDWATFTSSGVNQKHSCFAALLVEKPKLRSKVSDRWQRPGRNPKSSINTSGEPKVERIRFLTIAAADVLGELTDVPILVSDAVVRPFKPLFAFYEAMQIRFGESLESQVDGTLLPVNEPTQQTKNTSSQIDKNQAETAKDETVAQQDSGEKDRNHERNKVITAKAILNMMQVELRDDLKYTRVSACGNKECSPPEKPNPDDRDTPSIVGVKNRLSILTFSINFDGESFGPVQHVYEIEPWEGEQVITSLPIYPIEYADAAGSQGDSELPSLPSGKEAELRARGRRFCEIVNTPQVAHREYRGLDLGVVREQIDSEVIVDMSYYYRQYPMLAPWIGLTRPLQEIVPVWVWTSQQIDNCCFREVFGHHLDVNYIKHVEQRPQSFDELVLPQDYKRLVKSLVKTHSTGIAPTSDSVGQSRRDERSDLVRGKGKGVIILLHGVPGVGKSSTAECVAEYTKRPLLSITCGDIGQTAEDVQKNLEESLSLAHRWGCVMLLDEADVFLATRDKRDLKRNAIVSVFLRVLEYYSGILFLTTNKVGLFDEAFKSRIHLSLYYDKLTADQTWKIWDVNLTRQMSLHPNLKTNKEDLLRWAERNYHQCRLDGTQVWNGRQIRNACQTAAALAEADEEGFMRISHLEAVAKASLDFDRYLESVYGGDDAHRVRRAGEREDAFTARGERSPVRPEDNPRYSDFYHDRGYGHDSYYPSERMTSARRPRGYQDERTHDSRSGGGDRFAYDGRRNEGEERRYTHERRSSPTGGF